MEAFKTWIRHNQSMMISTVLLIAMALWFFGCQSTTQSLTDCDTIVNEGQLSVEYGSELRRLENEMATLKAATEIRMQDLHRQDVFKQALFKSATLIAEGNNPNPLGFLSLAGTLLGIGAVIDNRKKDGIIKGLQSGDD